MTRVSIGTGRKNSRETVMADKTYVIVFITKTFSFPKPAIAGLGGMWALGTRMLSKASLGMQSDVFSKQNGGPETVPLSSIILQAASIQKNWKLNWGPTKGQIARKAMRPFYKALPRRHFDFFFNPIPACSPGWNAPYNWSLRINEFKRLLFRLILGYQLFFSFKFLSAAKNEKKTNQSTRLIEGKVFPCLKWKPISHDISIFRVLIVSYFAGVCRWLRLARRLALLLKLK